MNRHDQTPDARLALALRTPAIPSLASRIVSQLARRVPFPFGLAVARPMALPILLFAALLCAAPAADAHKVIISAWPLANDIEGEVGFSNGQMAAPGTRIEVLGPDGESLGETEVGDDGLFRFTPSATVPHTLRADLGAGHVAETTLPVDELPASASASNGTASAEPTARADDSTPREQDTSAAIAIERDALAALVAHAVQQEIRPLRRELIRLRETQRLHEIIGGLGYIAGLFGLLFFVYARHGRRERRD
ncbi:MAG: hypothetical protein ACLFN3_02270 [Halochromatium sp.]